jgi:NitT/TauT family transport system substrate-binding protein
MILLLRRGLLVWALVLVLTIAEFLSAAEEKKTLPNLQPEKAKVRAAYAGSSGAFVALWATVEKGYFKEFGLSVEPIFTRTVSGVQAIVSGDVQFIYSACSQIMTARKAGADLTILAAMVPYNLYLIVSRPEIKDLKQLAGKRLAIAQFGDTTHLSARFALQQGGLDPDSVTYLQVGGTPERLAALQSGSVDAALQSAQSLEIVKSLGMNVLVNLFEKRLPYCGSGIGVSRAFIQTNPRTVEAFMRGFVKGNAFAREGNPVEVKSIMSKYMRIDANDRRLIEAYNFYPRLVNVKHPAIPHEGLAFIIDELSYRDKTWREWKPEQFYDSSIVDRLKNEGFLDEVYKQIR